MVIETLLYLSSFVAIWLGADLIIKSIDRIARKLKLSTFAVSFFLLGILTSIPEIAISATAVANRMPEIFVGNLLGGIIVIFLLVVPLLAVVGKGIRINHDLDKATLILTILVMIAPSLLLTDQKMTTTEGLFLIFLYGSLFYFVQSKHGIFDHQSTRIMELKAYSFLDLAKVGLGVAIVFLSSQYIVRQTIAFSELLNIPSYYISLLALSIGTNLPELSIAIKAVISGKKDVAFGDYLGSAAANTLLFGIFTLINEGEVFTYSSFFMTFLFTAVGLVLFYRFSRSNKFISVPEGLVLLGIYGLFLAYEIIRALPVWNS